MDPGLVGAGSGAAGSGDGALGASGTCLGETRAAEAIDLDIFIMLDSSASMLDTLPRTLLSAPSSKWDAVRQSMVAFVQAPETQEIGIGLQYFPQVQEGVPFSCESSAQCGSGGPCSNTACVVVETQQQGGGAPPLRYVRLPDNTPQLCSTDGDCATVGGTCRSVLGQCIVRPGALAAFPEGAFIDLAASRADPPIVPLCTALTDCNGLPGTTCEPIGLCADLDTPCTPSLPCPAGLGTCQGVPNACVNQTQCDVGEYSAAAVPISNGLTRNQDIVTSLQAKVPNGRTPTAPALSGALAQAQEWATQNPSHQVVTVLATDGFPTECEPVDIPQIGQIARTYASASPSVKTFVIGVFSDSDLGQDGQARLDALARAGGTQRAFVVNTGRNVAEEFLNALNVIRTTAIGCEFRLDAEAALDFEHVNLNVTAADGSKHQLFNVSDAAACANDDQGWYYERDAAGVPTQVNVCPGACAGFEAGGTRVDLQIGCATLIR